MSSLAGSNPGASAALKSYIRPVTRFLVLANTQPGRRSEVRYPRAVPGDRLRPMDSDKKQPAVRLQWLIAMAIVGVALLALVWVLFASSGSVR